MADQAQPTPSSSSTSTSTSTTTPHPLPLPYLFTHPPTPQLITQGAEALLFKTTHLTPSNPAALKFRPSKPYRHPTLDARLTKQRVLAEARVLVKLGGLRREGIAVPAVLGLEWDVGRKVRGLDGGVREVSRGLSGGGAGAGAWLLMEWIEGMSVKDLLREWDAWVKGLAQLGEGAEGIKSTAEADVKKLLNRVGRAVAALHSNGGVVHGDLTSSNIMVRPLTTDTAEIPEPQPTTVDIATTMTTATTADPPNLEGEIVLIDFGLATQSVQEEDRAVDLYVLERAFGSTHPRQEGWFDAEVLQSQAGYRGFWKGSARILSRLEEVRMRGRKRTMVG